MTHVKYAQLAVFLLLATAIFIRFNLGFQLLVYIQHASEKKSKAKNFKPPGKFRTKLNIILEKQKALIASSPFPKPFYRLLSAGCAVLGFFAGRIIFHSMVISATVAVIGFLLPLLFLSFRQSKNQSTQLGRLASSMMILSNSYVVTEDFITSVRSNLDLLDYAAPFRDFLTYATMMDSNMTAALRRMERQIPNPYFSQWVDALVLAQDDRALKYATVSIVDSFHDVLQAQQEADAIMYGVWREYAVTLALIFSTGSEKYDRNVAELFVLLQVAAELEAVSVRHVDVTDYDVRQSSAHKFPEGRIASRDSDHFRKILTQSFSQEVQQVLVVIDNHKFHSGSAEAVLHRCDGVCLRRISEKLVQIGLRFSFRSLHRCRDRNFPPECSSLVRVVVHPDASSMHFHKNLRVGESDAASVFLAVSLIESGEHLRRVDVGA